MRWCQNLKTSLDYLTLATWKLGMMECVLCAAIWTTSGVIAECCEECVQFKLSQYWIDRNTKPKHTISFGLKIKFVSDDFTQKYEKIKGINRKMYETWKIWIYLCTERKLNLFKPNIHSNDVVANCKIALVCELWMFQSLHRTVCCVVCVCSCYQVTTDARFSARKLFAAAAVCCTL